MLKTFMKKEKKLLKCLKTKYFHYDKKYEEQIKAGREIEEEERARRREKRKTKKARRTKKRTRKTR